MKKNILYLIFYFTILFILPSCNHNDNMDFNDIKCHKIFTTTSVSDTAFINCDVNINFLYPNKFHDKKILENVKKELIAYALDSTFVNFNSQDAVNRFVDNTSKNFYFTITSLQKLGKGKQLHYKENWNLKTKVIYNDKNILSYKLYKQVYTGGAHGMEIEQYLVFDLKTGKKLTEHDIFEDGFEPKLIDLIKKQIMFDRGYESEEQMLNNGFFGINNIKPNGNFAISDSAITYIFNPYEIASYANGKTEVSIPFNKIKFVLRKQSPISHLFNK